MALKAYRHLTDGEVKIVEADSAEETALLADTVRGASYVQMTSSGHAQEVAAAQGTALWVDVTSDLGGGGGGLPTGMDYQVIEVTDLVIPTGTDWSSVVHEVGSFDVAPGQYIAAHSFFIEGVISGADQIDFATEALPSGDVGVTTSVQVSIVAGTAWQQMAGRQPVEFTNPVGEPGWTVPVFLRTSNGVTTEDISVTARAAFLII